MRKIPVTNHQSPVSVAIFWAYLMGKSTVPSCQSPVTSAFYQAYQRLFSVLSVLWQHSCLVVPLRARSRLSYWLFSVLSVFSVVPLLPSPALAQAATRVSVAPQEIEINAGGTAVLSLQVTGGVEVNAFDFKLSYDPAVLSLESYAYGPYLSNLAQVVKQDEPGSFRLVCTQLATPAVSGDGVLVELVFRGLAEGSSSIVLEELSFAGSAGGLVHPELEGGFVRVGPAPTSTLTPTEVPPSETPLPTPTLTAVPPTGTPLSPPTRTAVLPAATPTAPISPPTQGAPQAAPSKTPVEGSIPVPTVTGTGAPAESQPGSAPPLSAGTATAISATLIAVRSPLEDSITEEEPPSTPQPVVLAEEPPADDPSRRVIETVLWGVLAACGLAIALILAALLRQGKTGISTKENH